MTISYDGLEEEMDALTNFLYGSGDGGDLWREYCDKKRKDAGNHSLEHISMLVRSITQPHAWRYILSGKDLDNFRKVFKWLSTAKVVEKRDDEDALGLITNVELNEMGQALYEGMTRIEREHMDKRKSEA